VNRDDVRHIAALARLELREDQIEKTAAELSGIIAFVETLRQLDLEGCEPSAFAPADTPLREDVPDGRQLTSAAALASAPAAEDGFFLVPPIVENVNP
jgi:aspartyl-tRNA(Asn)/glutamyl-tRNA(Gln) amidotransferase subunit C